MKRSVLLKIFSCFLLVSILLTSCSDSGVRSVVAIGDSIGNGYNIAYPWPLRLETALGVPLNNNSVSGEETGYGLRIIEGLLVEHKPSHVTIMLGTNDATRGSVPNAIVNLQAMVDIALKHDVVAIVGTLPPNRRSKLANARAAEISDGIRGLSGAIIAEVRGAMGDGALLIADGVHPNDDGQKMISDAFLGALKP